MCTVAWFEGVEDGDDLDGAGPIQISFASASHSSADKVAFKR